MDATSFWWGCATRSLVYVWFYVDVVCPFVLFLLAIVLSVLRFTDSDYPVGIFKFLYIPTKSVVITLKGRVQFSTAVTDTRYNYKC